MREPSISVIIPVYNVEAYLADCLDSVLRQDFEEMEILCVDDCSTDGSRAILNRYAAKDMRIRIISYAENGGLSYARNRAMEQAKGEYIFFLDSDDMVADGAFNILYGVAKEEHLDAVRMDMDNIYNDGLTPETLPPCGKHHGKYTGTYTGQEIFAELIRQGDFFPGVVFFLWRRAFLQQYHIWFREGILHEDLAFTFAGLAFAKRVQVQLGASYIYRRRNASITTKSFTERNILGHIICYSDNLSILQNLHHDLDSAYLRAVYRYFSLQFNMCQGMIYSVMQSNLKAIQFENDMQAVLYDCILHAGGQLISGDLSPRMQEKLRKKEDIIIYGAGKIGLELLQRFERFGIKNYQLAVTKKSKVQTKGLIGMAHELRELQNLSETALVIVATGKRLHEEMEAEAKHQGFRHVVWYEDFFGYKSI